MLKIHQHFLLNILSLFAGVLIVASVIGYMTYKSIVIEDYRLRLVQEINLLELQLSSVEDINRFVREVRKRTGLRMTMIETDGTVFADSDYDAVKMENHAKRPEVVAASESEYGWVLRFSQTVQEDLLYVAKQVRFHDKKVTLRLAIDFQQMLERFWGIMANMLMVFAFFAAFALVITFRMSRHMRSDVAQIAGYLEAIGEKKYKSVLKIRYYGEFLQIAILLKNLVKRLKQHEKQRRKHTAKLRMINQQRTDFLSALSHEFKNPIAAIIGYAGTLIEDPDIEPKIRQRFLGKILSNADKMTGMLDRMSFSVKLENNDLQLHQDGFDLKGVCEDSVANLSKKYPSRTILCRADSTPIFADKAFIEVALTNLIDNALKYSDEKVEVVLHDDRLSVRDYGLGIAPKELENITSKYYRVNKNTWDNSMGLGLSIVVFILKQHRTRLDIESILGEGSVFSFDVSPMRLCDIEQRPKTEDKVPDGEA